MIIEKKKHTNGEGMHELEKLGYLRAPYIGAIWVERIGVKS
jgi:hypothetical protein